MYMHVVPMKQMFSREENPQLSFNGVLQLFCTIWFKYYMISFRFIVLASFGDKMITYFISVEKRKLNIK